MRYLKHINEVIYTDPMTTEEIQDLSETCLAYLLDEGFQIVILNTNRLATRAIRITKMSTTDNVNGCFTWNEVKDQVIPFLKILINKVHEIHKVEIGQVDFSYKECIEDNITDPDSIKSSMNTIYIKYVA